MSPSYSPLRYPGGKGVLADFLIDVILSNNLEGCTYIEPFAGGAGAAITLLFEGIVKELYLNDADISISAFWNAVLNETEKLFRLIHDTPVTIDEWQKQRRVLLNEREDLTKLGFAAFFLNRCNRSGIIYSAGPIGGYEQKGKWNVDVRFNKDTLIKRIEKIARHRDNIHVTNKDVIQFLGMLPMEVLRAAFIYLDPPYFVKGKKLYLNFFQEDDHKALFDHVSGLNDIYWLMTYDDAQFIRLLYDNFRLYSYQLNYSLQKKRKGEELLIAPKAIYLPSVIKMNGQPVQLNKLVEH